MFITFLRKKKTKVFNITWQYIAYVSEILEDFFYLCVRNSSLYAYYA